VRAQRRLGVRRSRPHSGKVTAISRVTASEADVSAFRRSESAVTPTLDGLDLPDEVRQKIYYGNALQVTPGLPPTGWSWPRISRIPRITPPCSTPYGRPPGGGRRPPSWQAKMLPC
jgi:hypothetical protein